MTTATAASDLQNRLSRCELPGTTGDRYARIQPARRHRDRTLLGELLSTHTMKDADATWF